MMTLEKARSGSKKRVEFKKSKVKGSKKRTADASVSPVYRRSKKRISPEAVQRAFKEWLLGKSLRDLEYKYGFHRCTFSYQFRKFYGENYADLKKFNGVLNILKEYRNSDLLSSKDKLELTEFIEENKEFLFEVDLANRDCAIYTEKQIDNMGRPELNRSTCDFREVCERSLLAGYNYGTN